MSLAPQSRVGPYEIVSAIGAVGMDEIRRAGEALSVAKHVRNGGICE
jgi:hypothetical protein